MQRDVLAVATDAYPGRVVRIEGEGQLSVAVRVGDDLLVRFPRHRFGVDRLAFEVRLLEQIRSHLSAAVPEILEVALDRPIGEAYVAHRYLPGRILEPAIVAAWAPARLEDVSVQIATFVEELHGLAGAARSAGAPQVAPRAFAESLAAEFDELLGPRASDAALARAYREIAALAALPDTPTVLCHTDLGGNILVDESTGAVAVIDFGSCMVTHPAFDVATLSVLGDDLVAACIDAYPDLGAVVDNAGAVRDTFALQDALYGARQEDWAYVDDILTGYSLG